MRIRGGKKPGQADSGAVLRLRRTYECFRRLQTLNNECLEGLSSLQEDLRYLPPTAPGLQKKVSSLVAGAREMVGALEEMSGTSYARLIKKIEEQKKEVVTWLASERETSPRIYSAWLSDLSLSDEPRVGAKAAALGEVENEVNLPVPPGYVLTVDAYDKFFGLPCWIDMRDTLRGLTAYDAEAIGKASSHLTNLVMNREIPREVEVAVCDRAARIAPEGEGLAVRSSAVGEGVKFSFAGQFLSILNVPHRNLLRAYREVVASRFSERAIGYRLLMGIPEVDNPMAVLFLPTIKASAAGILYTRNPSKPNNREVWISATIGLGADIAGGEASADHFTVSRSGVHTVLERKIVNKSSILVADGRGGTTHREVDGESGRASSIHTEHLQILADWGVRLEKHFGTPQDVEWVLDEDERLWIVQTRPLILSKEKPPKRVKGPEVELVSGGRTVYPGRISSDACVVSHGMGTSDVPRGSIAIMKRPNAEIVRIFPRISGLAAEYGNETGHAAALLREFRIPSIFNAEGVTRKIADGDMISLDAHRGQVLAGELWPGEKGNEKRTFAEKPEPRNPVESRLVNLNLLDPNDVGFRISRCRSIHDVVRFIHQKTVETMFNVNDEGLREGVRTAKLITPVPVNVYVMDLGGGFAPGIEHPQKIVPDDIVSRPFNALWSGITHPGVKWQRQMPASFEGISSVLARSLTSRPASDRDLGDRSYMLVSDEHMNLNTRLAYHFTLVDSCLSDTRNRNYIAFRFAGGGASRRRRRLRARFIVEILDTYGFSVDQKEDIVNAWFKKGSAVKTGERLDILGRLISCTGQLDMYMTGEKKMQWYVEQFFKENYRFTEDQDSSGSS